MTDLTAGEARQYVNRRSFPRKMFDLKITLITRVVVRMELNTNTFYELKSSYLFFAEIKDI